MSSDQTGRGLLGGAGVAGASAAVLVTALGAALAIVHWGDSNERVSPLEPVRSARVFPVSSGPGLPVLPVADSLPALLGPDLSGLSAASEALLGQPATDGGGPDSVSEGLTAFGGLTPRLPAPPDLSVLLQLPRHPLPSIAEVLGFPN